MGNRKRKPINLVGIQALDDTEVLEMSTLTELTGLCPNTLRAMFKDGRLQGRKIQNMWFCRGDALKQAFGITECVIDI